MISKEVDYAIRALLYLAQHATPSERHSVAEIAETMHIPYSFLRSIIRLLAEKGFIESKRGNGGGLCLALPPEQFSLYDVLKAVSPNSYTLNSCLVAQGSCERDHICPVHCRLNEVQQKIDASLKAIRFDQLLEK